jgi:hypothetical protein
VKLAEALLLRADLQKKVASLRDRCVANAVVQEGEVPHEDPQSLLMTAFGVLDQLEELVSRINRTNLAATLPDGRTLTAAIAHRDRLIQAHSLLQATVAGCRRSPSVTASGRSSGRRRSKWRSCNVS